MCHALTVHIRNSRQQTLHDCGPLTLHVGNHLIQITTGAMLHNHKNLPLLLKHIVSLDNIQMIQRLRISIFHYETPP